MSIDINSQEYALACAGAARLWGIGLAQVDEQLRTYSQSEFAALLRSIDDSESPSSHEPVATGPAADEDFSAESDDLEPLSPDDPDNEFSTDDTEPMC